jgi:hypothetical protein
MWQSVANSDNGVAGSVAFFGAHVSAHMEGGSQPA